MRKKKSLFLILFLLIGIGVTLAYFTSTSMLENEFKSGKYKTVSTDSFTSPSGWMPGDITPKTITTKNEGTFPVRVRVRLNESWKSKNGDDLSLEYNDERVAIINFINDEDWINFGDYYYYVGELAPGETTSSLIESIKYNPNVPSNMNCTNVNGVYNCASTGDGYDGGVYTLNVLVETVQSDAVLSAWELTSDPTIERYVYNGNSSEIRIGSSIIEDNVVNDYQSTNSDIFLRYTVLGQTIKQIDVGFIYNNNVYYIKGAGATLSVNGNYYNYDSIYYTENRTTLLNVFGSQNCTGDESISTECLLNGFTTQADSGGNVFASNGSWVCGVYDGGSSNCFNDD